MLVVTRVPAAAPKLGDALRRAGLDVVDGGSATDGSVLSSGDVDVAVVDVGLAGPEGLVLCRDVRRRCGAPVVVIAAQTGAADAVAYLEAGVDDYVVWPVDPAVVTARLRAVLRREPGCSADATADRG